MTKSLYEAAGDYLVEQPRRTPEEASLWLQDVVSLSERKQMIDNLQWAKEFMERYERKHESVKR